MTDYKTALLYAPKADDVWFWGASIVAGTPKRKINWEFHTVSYDAIYQYFHQGSALQHSNVKGHEITNDTQIAATWMFIKEKYGVS